jgi:hypothetical protein
LDIIRDWVSNTLSIKVGNIYGSSSENSHRLIVNT